MTILPIKTVGGLNARENWRTRAGRVKRERYWALMYAKQLLKLYFGEPRTFHIVTLTRLSSGTLDSDNLQGSLKAIRDGVADAIGMPDNDPRIEWQYAQEKCKRGDFGVKIEIAGRPK